MGSEKKECISGACMLLEKLLDDRERQSENKLHDNNKADVTREELVLLWT